MQLFINLIFLQVRQVIERISLTALAMTRNDVDYLYETLGNDDEVIAALEDRVFEKGHTFNLRENVDTVLYELRAAAKAFADWQPSKVMPTPCN